MTTLPLSIEAHQTLAKAPDLVTSEMAERKYGSAIVDNLRFGGIFTTFDACRAALRALAREPLGVGATG